MSCRSGTSASHLDYGRTHRRTTTATHPPSTTTVINTTMRCLALLGIGPVHLFLGYRVGGRSCHLPDVLLDNR